MGAYLGGVRVRTRADGTADCVVQPPRHGTVRHARAALRAEGGICPQRFRGTLRLLGDSETRRRKTCATHRVQILHKRGSGGRQDTRSRKKNDAEALEQALAYKKALSRRPDGNHEITATVVEVCGSVGYNGFNLPFCDERRKSPAVTPQRSLKAWKNLFLDLKPHCAAMASIFRTGFFSSVFAFSSRASRIRP